MPKVITLYYEKLLGKQNQKGKKLDYRIVEEGPVLNCEQQLRLIA